MLTDAALEPHLPILLVLARLLPGRLLEHAVEPLIRSIAARLCRLCRLQSLIRSALSAGSSLLRLSRRALRSVGRVLGSLGSGFHHVELLRSDMRTAGHEDRKAADERRCPQSSLDFCGHLYNP